MRVFEGVEGCGLRMLAAVYDIKVRASLVYSMQAIHPDIPDDSTAPAPHPPSCAQNGRWLTPDHGFPVRIIIPGFIGGRMVKWLSEITVESAESQNHYHFFDNRVLPRWACLVMAVCAHSHEHSPGNIASLSRRGTPRVPGRVCPGS